MSHYVYRYTFDDATPMLEVQLSLLLAVFCAEGLHGRAQVRLDARFTVDEERRVCVVDVMTPAGRSVAQIFTELVIRKFGQDAFAVEAIGRDARVENCGRGTSA